MARVHITELTLRDAHQSLFATRMLTADMPDGQTGSVVAAGVILSIFG